MKAMITLAAFLAGCVVATSQSIIQTADGYWVGKDRVTRTADGYSVLREDGSRSSYIRTSDGFSSFHFDDSNSSHPRRAVTRQGSLLEANHRPR